MSEEEERNAETKLPTSDSVVRGGLPAGLLNKLRIRIPGYKLLGVIGHGGQATVYRAIEETSQMTVAIKLLHSGALADAGARERLRLEVQAMKALEDCKNIVCAFDSGQTADGHDYLVMNYIDGKPLDDFWKHKKPAPDSDEPAWQLKLFTRICRAVNIAHLRGITHRDLSPSNILVDGEGQPHILDFGLARTAFDKFSPSRPADLSVTGQFLGKLAYASPEQARGKPSAIDIRTDVYALGVILYQIVTHGRFPYEVVGSLIDVLNNIIFAKPTPPSKLIAADGSEQISKQRKLKQQLRAPINKTIEAIVLKALEKNPNDRYQNAGELAHDIEQYLGGHQTLAGQNTPVEVGVRKNLPRLTPRKLAAVTGPILGVMLVAPLFWHFHKPAANRISAATPAVAIDPEPVTSAAPLPPVLNVASTNPSLPALQKLVPNNALLPSLPVRLQLHTAPDSPPSASQATVDLLKLINLQTNLLAGTGERSGSGFVLRQQYGVVRLEFPFVPPAEYDYKISFYMQSENPDFISLVCAEKSTQFLWVTAGRNNKACGFEAINGLSVKRSANPTVALATAWYSAGTHYTTMVKVRRDGVEGYIDGRLISSWKTNYSDMGLIDTATLNHRNTVGFSSNSSQVTIDSAEITPLSGEGRILQPAPLPTHR